ncbi:STAS domain-containing protein [Marinomonas sp. PE14-40]|uniref:STAS domain-containing protein n=1 Tax=Marinomonas sp. PE14-40 TaxID=3060621 RepID=UPI003F6699C6
MLELVENDKEISILGLYKASELMRFDEKLTQCLIRLNVAKDLNLTSLEGSDSGLIALLLSYQRFANKKHWQVKLINASAGVKGLIELSQLNDFFTLVDDK